MKRALITTLAIAAFFALLWTGVREMSQVECEACVRYGGRVQCRTVLGATRDEAAMGAVANACALLTGGVTDTKRCQRTAPESLDCRER